MAARVEIIIQAKDAASQVLRGVTSQFGALGGMIDAFASGNALEAITGAIVKFGVESVKATQDYAAEVEKLSYITGNSYEETSRLIQVADDYVVSTEALTMAQKSLAKDGIQLTTESLARLSDEYNAIQDPAQKALFLTEKFGRSGYELAKMMQVGGDAIRANAAAINDSLIMTDKQIAQAEELRTAQDELNDNWEAMKVKIGSDLIPVLADLTEEMNIQAEVNERMAAGEGKGAWWEGRMQQVQRVTQAVREERDAQDAANKAMIDGSKAASGLGEAYGEVIDPLIEINKLNQQRLGLAENIFEAEQEFQSKINDLQSERADVQGELDAAIAQGWWEGSEKVQDYKSKLSELDQKIAETAEAHNQASQKIVYDLILQKLAVEGISDAEFEMMIEAGKALGVVDEKSANTAKSLMGIADAFESGVLSAEHLSAAIGAIPDEKQVTVTVLQQGYDMQMLSQSYGTGAGGTTSARAPAGAPARGAAPAGGGSSIYNIYNPTIVLPSGFENALLNALQV